MPWNSPEEFAKKHWKDATPAQAKSAKRRAEAMIRRGVPEGEAIATAIKGAKHTKKYD